MGRNLRDRGRPLRVSGTNGIRVPSQGRTNPGSNALRRVGGCHMSSIRVLVASHIRLYREGLERVLAESPDFTLAGSACCAPEAVEQTHRLRPDIALLDMAMSGAFAAAKELAQAGCSSK